MIEATTLPARITGGYTEEHLEAVREAIDDLLSITPLKRSAISPLFDTLRFFKPEDWPTVLEQLFKANRHWIVEDEE